MILKYIYDSFLEHENTFSLFHALIDNMFVLYFHCSGSAWGQMVYLFHFILECKALIDRRKDYLGKYYTQRPNVIKFKEIMSTQNEKMLKKLCMFILKIYEAVCPPWFRDYYFLSVISLYILYLWLVCSLLYICYYCTSCTNIGLRE